MKQIDESKGFLKMYWSVLDELTWNEACFLAYLIFIWGILKETITVDGKEYKRISDSFINERIDYCGDTIKKYLNTLKDLGYIDIYVGRNQKKQKARYYKLNVTYTKDDLTDNLYDNQQGYLSDHLPDNLSDDLPEKIGLNKINKINKKDNIDKIYKQEPTVLEGGISSRENNDTNDNSLSLLRKDNELEVVSINRQQRSYTWELEQKFPDRDFTGWTQIDDNLFSDGKNNHKVINGNLVTLF